MYRTEYLCCLKTEKESLFENIKFTLTSLTAIKCVIKKDCCDDYLNLKNSFYQLQIQSVEFLRGSQ